MYSEIWEKVRQMIQRYSAAAKCMSVLEYNDATRIEPCNMRAVKGAA